MIQTNILEYLEKTVKEVPDKTAYTDGKHGLTFAEVSVFPCDRKLSVP